MSHIEYVFEGIGSEIIEGDSTMVSKTMDMASVDRSIQSVPERLNRITEEFRMSKDALHDWVAEQKRLIDEEERQISLREEAIDVEYGDPADESEVCVKDEADFNALTAAADRLLSENSEGV